MRLSATSLLLALTSLTSAATITSTITAATTQATSTPDKSYTDNTTFQHDILLAHNFYRTEHATSNLTWNSTSADTATKWSQRCVFEHSTLPTGENLASGYPNTTSSISAWALERESYSYSSPGFSEKTGHFTQLVWSNTTTVGCGRTDCTSKGLGWYVVCEYWPRGNIVGVGKDKGIYFGWNVKKQVEGKPSDTVEGGVSSGAASFTSKCAALMTAVVGAVVFAGLLF